MVSLHVCIKGSALHGGTEAGWTPVGVLCVGDVVLCVDGGWYGCGGVLLCLVVYDGMFGVGQNLLPSLAMSEEVFPRTDVVMWIGKAV